ncbi:MAG: hypothetical protein RMI91_12255 [Gemmatales bacterium]|nr:hypothetical protein [Gemmatales bacterium]MDW7995413.1 hypothetical protein [Gemmatales bacterium]
MLAVKRLLGIVACLAACLVLYQVYVFFLGGYDGFAPLPAEFWPRSGEALPASPRDQVAWEPPVVRKLRQAFGPLAKEAERPILIESVQHGLLLAAQKVFLSQEGKLELEQASLAIFGKKRGEDQVEICTLQGERAIIEFDKPLTSVRDVAHRKPVAGRIEGRIDPVTGKTHPVHLRHNRRTANPDDDLHLYTDWLQYDDRQHRIWTDAAVEIVDSDPDTAKVTGLGLEVLLETQPSAKSPASSQRPTITGVHSVELSRNVQMYFQVEAGAALLGKRSKPDATINPGRQSTSSATSPLADNASQKAKTTRPSFVKVLAGGPFIYRVPDDRAEFHHRVHLLHIVSEGHSDGRQQLDELRCHSLTLQFRRPRAEKKPANEDKETTIELVAARAVGDPVEIVLESENLQASGSELVFDRTNHSASLVGKPLEAVYDGHRLQLMGTLTLQAQGNQFRELREAQTRGPGTAWLRGRQGNPTALIVRWREQMQLQRDGTMERLLLTGNVLLEEPQHGSLRADQLLLWLEAKAVRSAHDNSPRHNSPAEAKTSAENAPNRAASHGVASAPEQSTRGRVPRCLEASGNVSLQSETLIVPHAERLRVELQEDSSESAEKPDRPSSSATDTAALAQARSGSPLRENSSQHLSPAPAQGQPPQPASGAPDRSADKAPQPASQSGTTPRTEATSRPPLVLRARTIEAVAAGTPTRADLRMVAAHGQVQIDQAHAQDRTLQVRCSSLRLTRTAHGDMLRLEGTPAQPAYVQLGAVALRGPVIKLDQVLNTIDVEGLGSMRLPSRNDFQGQPLREPVEVVVDWNQSMFFDGRLAEFDGGVQAVQGQSRLACRRLSLLLDRKVSFREQKTSDLKRSEPAAGLSRLMCEQDVRLEKVILEEDRYRLLQRIEARELAYDHELATLTAYGPGTVTVFQPHQADQRASGAPLPIAIEPRLAEPAPAKVQTDRPSFKLTRIHYDGFLQITKAADKQTDIVSFAGGISLIHLSADDPDIAVPPERLPEDALNLSCGQLKITSRKVDNGSTAQELLAEQNVRVRAKQFHALADRVSFDEAKDLLILEGANGATLYRQRVPGGEFEPVRAKRIWFWRRENRVRFDGTESIQLNP